MKNKKTQTGIIVAVVFILVALVAIGIYAGFLNKQVTDVTEEDISTEALTAVYSIKEPVLYVNKLDFKINRPSGNGNLTMFLASVENADKSVYSWKIDSNLPNELETKEYSIDLNEKITNPSIIKIVPVYGKQIGLEADAKIIISDEPLPTPEEVYALNVTNLNFIDLGVSWTNDLRFEFESKYLFRNSIDAQYGFIPSPTNLGKCGLNISDTLFISIGRNYTYTYNFVLPINSWNIYSFLSSGEGWKINGNALNFNENRSSTQQWPCGNVGKRMYVVGNEGYIRSIQEIKYLKIYNATNNQLLNNFVAKPKIGDTTRMLGCFQDIANGNREFCSTPNPDLIGNAQREFQLINYTGS